MVSFIRVLAIAAWAAVVTTGCSSSGGGSDPDVQPILGANGEDLVSKYEGTFQSACLFNPIVDRYVEITVTIIGQNAVRILNEFTDEACQALSFSDERNFTITYPGGTVPTRLGDADFVDLFLDSLVQDGTPVDLSGFTDDELLRYDIVFLSDGSSLYVGQATAENDTSTPETRPIALEQFPLVIQ